MPRVAASAPAILDGLRRANIRVTVVQRTIKLLRPICATCQRGANVAPDWFKRCEHNPYISIRKESTKVPLYEDLPDGRKKLVGQDEIHSWHEQPNWVQVPLSPRISSGLAVERKMRAGFILPEDLRTPEYPNGIKNPCEFRDCFAQKGLKGYRWGTFCRLREAQLVGHDMRMEGGGGALEIGDGVKSAEKQAKQLADVPV